jgi:methylmalonyl-CoA mutase N-terminal domain/subunit
VTYCDTVVERGRMTIDQFAPQISFFFYTHGDFFEEIAKYRAGRRRWATIVRERWGAKSDKAAMFRFGCVRWRVAVRAAGAEQPGPGGLRGHGVGARRRAVDVHRRLGRTLRPAQRGIRHARAAHQQILAYETGVMADPLGGSYFVEALTDATEERIIEIMADLENHGGMVRCIEDGYLQGLIADEAYKIHLAEESGAGRGGPQQVRLRRAATGHLHLRTRRSKAASATQAARTVKAERDSADVAAKLAPSRAARGDNLMHALIDCANAYCTVGEMVTALKDGANSNNRWCSRMSSPLVSWWPSPASTATIAAPRSSPAPCATPDSR